MILPPPGESFGWTHAPLGPTLVCGPLARVAAHAFTTRSWPLAVPETDSNAGWADVARLMRVEPDSLVRVRQVHGAGVAIIRAGQTSAGSVTADIIASDDPTVALAIRTADCVPLLVADERTGAVAAAHAGWRGVSLGVPSVTLNAMARVFGSRPPDLIVAVGPAIGACCYEVGTNVRKEFERAGFSTEELAAWFLDDPRRMPSNPPMKPFPHDASKGREFLDLWTATVDQLAAAGVPRHRIHISNLCTASHPQTFCSYRRDGSRAGRLAAVIRSGSNRFRGDGD